jgi:hypothetical protein
MIRTLVSCDTSAALIVIAKRSGLITWVGQ